MLSDLHRCQDHHRSCAVALARRTLPSGLAERRLAETHVVRSTLAGGDRREACPLLAHFHIVAQMANYLSRLADIGFAEGDPYGGCDRKELDSEHAIVRVAFGR